MTAQNYSKAVSDIKFLANRFSGILKVMDRIDELAEIENIIKERKDQLNELEVKHNRAEAEHRKSLEAITSENELKRDQILKEAREQASSLLSSSQQLAFRVHDFVNAVKDNAQKESDDVRSKTIDARDALTSIQSEHRHVQDEIDRISKEHAEIQHKVESMREKADGYLIKIEEAERAKNETIFHQNKVQELKNEQINLVSAIDELKRERSNLANLLSALHRKVSE